MVGEADAQHRITPRFGWRSNQMETGLFRGSAPFLHVARHAGTDDVIPTGAAAYRAGNDMVQGQFRGVKLLAAILTGITVAGEQVAPIELDLLPRELGKRQHPDDPGDGDGQSNRANPIVFGRLELVPEGAELRPILEVVGDVMPVLDVDDLGHGFVPLVALEKQHEGAARTDDAHRHVMGIEQKDIAVQRRGR